MVDNGLRFLTPKEYVFESIHKVPSVIRIEMTPEMSVFWIMGLFSIQSVMAMTYPH